jgi:hypothetical protein
MKTVYDKHNYRANHGTNQTSTFTKVIPSDRLTEPRYECANNPENRRPDETDRLVVASMINFAISPAMNPIMIVQIIPMILSLSGLAPS